MGRLAFLSLCCLFVALISLAQAVDLRGVHPSDAARYSGKTFECKDGSKTDLPLSKVNDDYCDCADGSDEPGTSACENGLFFCPNRGHLGLTLFSSRVNDGICDCCDGSDEYDGKVKCPDTCYALGEDTRNAKRQEIEAFKKGLEIRRDYEAEAKSVREEKKQKIEELNAALAQKQQNEKDLQAQVDALEAKAKAAEELLAQYKPKETLPGQEQAEDQSAEEDDEEGLDDDDDEEEEDDDGEEDEAEAAEKKEVQEEAKVLLERTDDVKEALEQAEKDIADLKELRDRLRSVRREVEDTATEISNLEDYFKLDMGEDAFHGIRDKTFELKTNEYTYKLTPFKEVKQQHTRLGEWGSWLNSEHTKMEYTGGERCWNGPDRKTIVDLTCSDTNTVLSVQEPNKCEYLMEFTTPAACSPERLAQLEQELARLENPSEVVVPLTTNDLL